jgi:hypothetical protein
VGAKPAELLLVRHRVLQRAEAGHDFFNGFPDQPLRVEFRRFADKLISFTQCKRKADAGSAFVVVQLRYGIGINRVAMNRIAAVAVADGKTRVAGGNLPNHKSKRPAITEFSATTDVHDVAGDEARLV